MTRHAARQISMTTEVNTGGSPDDLPPLSTRRCLVEVLLIVMVFFIATGDVAPNVNESHYLCRLKHYWDPEWCKGDLFLDSSDTQVLFIWMFGWVTRFVSLTATAWIGRVLAWSLLAWSWQRLSWRLVPRPLASVLSAALFVALNLQLHLAGEWVVGGVEAKCFAYAFVLMAIREVMDGRWNWEWGLLGAATAFHPIVGGWSGLICVGIWLLDSRRERLPLTMMPGFAAGAMIALVGILPALALTWHVPADVVDESSQLYVFDRLPHHLAPLTLPQEELTRRVAGHALLLGAFLVLSLVTRATGSASASLRVVTRFAWGAVLLAVIGFSIEIAFKDHPSLAAKLLRYYWFRMTDFGAAMAVALQLTSLIAEEIRRRRAWAGPLLVITLALVGWFYSYTAWTRYENRMAPADRKAADFENWVEVCDWVAANTPPNSLFITPRLNLSFKWRTGRPEVANRKDIPQDAPGIVEWHRRLKEIFTIEFGGQEQSVDSVGPLGTERVLELARKYHAAYVLSDRQQLLELPVAYQNDEYVVYRIEN